MDRETKDRTFVATRRHRWIADVVVVDDDDDSVVVANDRVVVQWIRRQMA